MALQFPVFLPPASTSSSSNISGSNFLGLQPTSPDDVFNGGGGGFGSGFGSGFGGGDSGGGFSNAFSNLGNSFAKGIGSGIAGAASQGGGGVDSGFGKGIGGGVMMAGLSTGNVPLALVGAGIDAFGNYSANKANRKRRDQILGIFGKRKTFINENLDLLEDEQKDEVDRFFNRQSSSALQNMSRRGLDSTTMLQSAQRGVNEDRSREMRRLQEAITKRRLDYNENLQREKVAFLNSIEESSIF